MNALSTRMNTTLHRPARALPGSGLVDSSPGPRPSPARTSSSAGSGQEALQPSHDLTASEVYNRVNLPWYNCGLDFGTTAWGDFGIASNPEAAADLDRLGQKGVQDVITWLSPDGRNLVFEPDGTPSALSPGFTEDLTAWLDLLAQRNMSAELVLIDGNTWCLPAESIDGVHFRGHGDVIMDPRKQMAFDDRILAPILQILADWQNAHPDKPFPVSGINLGNELLYGVNRDPEHPTKNVPTVSEMRDFVRGRAAYVHRHLPGVPVTLGAATVNDMLYNWTDEYLQPGPGEELDYYTFHHYSGERMWSVAERVDEEHVGKAVHLGEFPGRCDHYGFASPTEYLEAIQGVRNGVEREDTEDRFLSSAAMWAVHSSDPATPQTPENELGVIQQWFDQDFSTVRTPRP